MREHNRKAREKALEIYYEDPKRCLQCGLIIRVKENEKPSCTRTKDFCNKSCAAKGNNTKFPKRRARTKPCKVCGNPIKGQRKICDVCLSNYSRQTSETFLLMTKDELLQVCGSLSRARARIAQHARSIFQGQMVCHLCGYSKYVEICHLNPVASFPGTALIKEINDPNHLRALCANHHKELDLKLLDPGDMERLIGMQLIRKK